MTAPLRERHWLSGHLYLSGDLYGYAGDRMALDIVGPFVARARQLGWINRYFFIRYVDTGPHLRLRLCAQAAASSDIMAGISLVAPSVKWIAYEPEYDRYGAGAAMDFAEDLFQASSVAALALLAKLQTNQRPARLGKALLAMLLFVYLAHPTRTGASKFAEFYGTGSLGSYALEEGQVDDLRKAFDGGFARQAGPLSDYLEDAWERLSAGESLVSELDILREELTVIRHNLGSRCLGGGLRVGPHRLDSMAQVDRRVWPSQVHMMSNRLGISIAEEAYLAHLIARTLGAVGHESEVANA